MPPNPLPTSSLPSNPMPSSNSSDRRASTAPISRRSSPYYPDASAGTLRRVSLKVSSFAQHGILRGRIIRIILPNPSILNYSIDSVSVKLEMWETFFGSGELLLKQFKTKYWFFNYSIEKVVRPNLQLLKDECNISEERVSYVVRKTPRFITQKLDSLRALIGRVDELGIPRESLMFMWPLQVLYSLSEENVKAKHELMISLGWSDSDFSAAFRKAPAVLYLSPKELCRKMEFFVKEVGYTPSSIAKQSCLLLFSLDKRVIPRFRVMQFLHSKGLTQKKNLLSLLILSPKKFLEKFILPHKENVPELLNFFNTASAPCDLRS